jgi:excisionase family DNA binding protein
MEKLLVTVTQASEMLSLGKSTVYELVAKNIIPSIRLGRALRIPLRELEAGLKARVEGGESNA